MKYLHRRTQFLIRLSNHMAHRQHKYLPMYIEIAFAAFLCSHLEGLVPRWSGVANAEHEVPGLAYGSSGRSSSPGPMKW